MTDIRRARIKGALADVADKVKHGTDEGHESLLADAYIQTQKPEAIAGKIIAYIIAAAILVIASAGLIMALKLLGRAIGI
jgi:hypothetical protein